MTDTLPKGQILLTENKKEVVVDKLLGSGGQGEVYEVQYLGKPFALKWYYGHTATPKQLSNIKALVENGSPNDKFLWPLDVVEATQKFPGYGYIMKLRPSGYKGIIDLMARRSEPTFQVLATVGLQLAECYLKLHAKGLCYCDISFGNVFWNDSNGDILICDNDNVIENGRRPEVAGTIGFMAPELTVLPATATPSIDTDKHSLAVLLFYIFTLHHPLKGVKEEQIRALDQAARVKIYGKEPLFIFHPSDTSNQPHPQFHKVVLNFWPIYPTFLKELFTKAFTTGLTDPGSRVTENEWRSALVRLRDSIFYCQHCSAENFYDQDALRASGNTNPDCWACNKKVILPYRIRIGRNILMLNHNTKLFPHHLEPNNPFTFTTPLAEISQNPRNPGQWGLKNLGATNWTIEPDNSPPANVGPGQNAPLSNNLVIKFGCSEGQVRY